MSRSRLLTVATATAALLATGLATAVPASANAGVGSGFLLGPNGRSTSAFSTITRGINYGDGNRSVAITCEGLSTGDAVATSLDECALYVNGGQWFNQPLALPGATSVIGGFRVSVPSGASVVACTTVTSTFLDSSRQGVRGCSAPLTVL